MTGLYVDDSGNQVQVAQLALVTGKQQLVIGNSQNDLVLQTAGNITIQVGNKSYPLNFNATTTGNAVLTSQTTILATDSDLTTLTYPGDGNYVFVQQSKSFYITSNLSYVLLSGTPNNDVPVLYLSYSIAQSLTGTQKLLLSLNIGNIQSFSDIAGYTAGSVYPNQLVYNIGNAKHYVLTNPATPSASTSWTELYLPLKGGGNVTGQLTLNATSSLSTIHIEGQSAILDVRNNTTIDNILSIGKGDYSTGLAIWTNDTTYFQNLVANDVKGFKFVASNATNQLINPLTIYPTGVGIFSEPSKNFMLTVAGTSTFSGLATMSKGIQSINYATGTSGQGYTLTQDASSKWLLEVDRILVRDDIADSSLFSSKSIDGSYWSNPSIKISMVDYLDVIYVYTLAQYSGNYKDVGGSYILMNLSEKGQYALCDQPSDYTISGSTRTVSQMQIKFGNGDRDSSGTTMTTPTYIKDNTSSYVSITPTYDYVSGAFTPSSSGSYILNQAINIMYIETDSLSILNVGDLLYYATWNPDTTEQRVVAASVEVVNSTGAIVYVYNSETIDLNQEMILIARSSPSNGIHFNGIDQYGDYIEHLVNPSSFRDLFYNFFYSNEETEALPRNTYEPTTAVTVNKFGALDNLVDSDVGLNATAQIGIYSSNAYLKGNFVLNSATYNNVPVVTTTTDKFLMLTGSNTMEQVDLTTDFTNWNSAFSWGNHALAGYAYKATTLTATGNGIAGGGDLSANRTFNLDFTYLDSRYSLAGSIIVYSAELLTQTTSQTIGTYNVPSGVNGVYSINVYSIVTSLTSGSVAGSLTYTDMNGTTQTLSLATLSAVGPSNIAPIVIKAQQGTSISLSGTVTGTLTYDMGFAIQRLF